MLRSRFSTGLLLIFGVILASIPAFSQLSIPGTSNIYGAGHAVAPGPGGNGGGSLPILVDLPAGTIRQVTLTSVTGSVDYGPCCPANGADGIATGGSMPHSQYGGIAGTDFSARGRYLTGVFITDAEPTDPAPDQLVMTDIGFTELSPGLHQVFFTGDGLTGTGTGDVQIFHVPTGATRLYLGYLDRGPPNNTVPGWYGDNSGTMMVEVTVETDLSGVPERSVFQLMPNEPNPFNPSTTIRFRLVRVLLDEARPTGQHEVRWNGADTGGRAMPSGTYFYRLEANGGSESRVMTLLK